MPDLELNVLLTMEDVTRRVQDAVKRGMNDKDALAARKSEIAKIEKESLDSTGCAPMSLPYMPEASTGFIDIRSTPMSACFCSGTADGLFRGRSGQLHLSRYDLDMALFRAYENDRPVTARIS